MLATQQQWINVDNFNNVDNVHTIRNADFVDNVNVRKIATITATGVADLIQLWNILFYRDSNMIGKVPKLSWVVGCGAKLFCCCWYITHCQIQKRVGELTILQLKLAEHSRTKNKNRDFSDYKGNTPAAIRKQPSKPMKCPMMLKLVLKLPLPKIQYVSESRY